MYINAWLRQSFDGKHGVARRSKSSVRQYASRGELLEMVKTNSWHLIETDTHYIVIYDAGFLKFWR